MWNVPPELAEIEPKWNSKQVILYLSHPFRFHCTNGTSDQECRQLIKAQCTSSWCVRRSWVPEFPWSLIYTPHPHQTVCAPLRIGNCSLALKEVKLQNSRQKNSAVVNTQKGWEGVKLSQLATRDEHWIFGIKIAIPVMIPNGNVSSLAMNLSEYTLAFSCFWQRWTISAWEWTKPMEGKKETFGANLASMMFTYRLGGSAGRENIWLVVTSAFAMFSFGLHLWTLILRPTSSSVGNMSPRSWRPDTKKWWNWAQTVTGHDKFHYFLSSPSGDKLPFLNSSLQ